MRRNTLQLLAFASATALGIAVAADSLAQTETVNAQLITSSAISTTDTSDMDFGEWLIQLGPLDDAADDVTLTLTDDGSATAAIANNTDSTTVQITAPATEGVVNVQTPAPAVLTMTRSGSVDFADVGMSLTATTYRTATEGPSNINSDTDNGPVTTTVAATDEPVNFGGTITFSGTPADATHAASFDVTFTY